MNILLLSGFMTDDSLWDDVTPELKALGSVACVDLTRGGTIAEMAEMALAKAPARFIAIGFSMGGYVAREVVRLAPDRVDALILIATSARADTPAQQSRKIDAARAIVPERFHGLSRQSIVSSLHPDHAADEELIERIRDMSARVGGETFVRQSVQTRDGDLARLATICCPTLVIAAPADRLRSLEEARELEAGIAGAELALIEGAGHMIPIERPDALAALVAAWVRRKGLA